MAGLAESKNRLGAARATLLGLFLDLVTRLEGNANKDPPKFSHPFTIYSYPFFSSHSMTTPSSVRI